MSELPLGKVITFYSYKGGTGRSMALANVGVLLAQKWSSGQGVLLIDWDLEAPGLHRFFERNLLGKTDFEKQLGLIDFFYDLRRQLEKIEDGKAEIEVDQIFDKLNFDNYIIKTSVPSLFLMTAGSFNATYPSRVNSFNWENFFNKFPWAVRRLAEHLSKKYRYVLVDSRTGYTDTSGICTTLIPEKLVVVFTPNNQSLTGVLDLIRNATDYRRQSDDLRPLIVFPLVSRVEPTEPKLREDWRLGNSQKGIIGFQQQFEEVLRGIYNLRKCELKTYFDEVQIQQNSHYAYGEEIAVFTELAEDRFSLTRSYESFTQRLVLLDGPWEDLKVTQEKERVEEAAKEALQTALRSLSSEKRTVYGTLQQLDSETEELVDLAGVGNADRGPEVRVKLGEGITGRVAKTGESLRVDDLTDTMWNSIYFNVMAGNTRSELAVPLIRDGKVWGVLNIESPTPGAFDESDQRLLEAIAGQIMISLRNAEEQSKFILANPLNEDQWKILKLRTEGRSISEIAGMLGYSTSTIKAKLSKIYEIINQRNSVDAIRWYEQNASKYGRDSLLSKK